MSAPTARRPLRTRVVEPAAAAPLVADADAAGLAPLLVGLGEAARSLDLAERTVRRLAASGLLRYARVGRSLKFRPTDLRAFVDAAVVGPTPFPPARGRRAVP